MFASRLQMQSLHKCFTFPDSIVALLQAAPRDGRRRSRMAAKTLPAVQSIQCTFSLLC